jgi:hypothetical protein
MAASVSLSRTTAGFMRTTGPTATGPYAIELLHAISRLGASTNAAGAGST